jgi:anti-repressor protein
MNDLQVFQNQNFGQVRTTTIDGEPWFVAADVCRALEIGNPAQAMARLDDDEKGVISNDISQGRSETLNAVNEPGLYALVLGSRKPEAKAFKRWITHEVIPTIRKTGMYAVPKSLPEALRLAADLAEKIEKQKPLVRFAETCQSSTDSILIRELAKVCSKSKKIGQNNLFRELRKWGLLNSHNEPYQRYIDKGYFEVIERPIHTSEGIILKFTPKVLPKGQRYIMNRLEHEAKMEGQAV